MITMFMVAVLIVNNGQPFFAIPAEEPKYQTYRECERAAKKIHDERAFCFQIAMIKNVAQ